MNIKKLTLILASFLGADLAFWMVRSYGQAGWPEWLALVLGLAAILYLARAVLGFMDRLGGCRTALEAYGRGDLTGRLEVAADGDEVDRLGLEINKLGNSFTGIIGEILAANRTLAEVTTTFGDRFETIYGASEDMKARTQAVARNAEEASSGLLSISAAAEEMSVSVNTVAAAMDAMSGATTEVARNCVKESRIATEAERKAKTSQDFMERLGRSAQEIGRIISLINDIAERTNLLALNATIEAARAGAAGRGFTVVASEVKELALQTSKATAEIKAQIEAMQGNAESAVASMAEIARTIEDVNLISQSIAAAMEEQTATSSGIAQNLASASGAAGDIAKNVARSAQGIREVSTHIQGVSKETGQVAGGIADARGTAKDLVTLVKNLGGVIASFKTAAVKRVLTPDLFTGIDGMDNQHRRLFDLINQLSEAIGEGKGREVMGPILGALIDYTAKHFAEEEALMEEARYPGLEDQKRAHRAFVDKVLEFRAGFEAGTALMGSDIINFLSEWLIKHIGASDKKYGPHIKKALGRRV